MKQLNVPPIPTRISTPPDNFTDDEVARFASGCCLDCDSTSFVNGPGGGCSVNIACIHCGAEFNICSAALGLSHRNSPRGQPNRERLQSLFGITLFKAR